MKNLTLLLLGLPILLFSQKKVLDAMADVKNNGFRSVGDSILSKIAKGDIPSFSVGVSSNGQVIWKQSFGWADKEKKIPATPATPYALASLSKSITATAVMLLIQDGLISDPDQAVDLYLGDTKLRYGHGISERVTINQLLNMTAGIPHQWTYAYTDEKKQAPRIEETIKHYGWVAFPPGKVFHYSNLSPGIAEKLISNVSQKPFAAFMKEELFVPLGMAHAAVNRNELRTITPAKGYSNKGKPLAPSMFYPSAGAGFYGSINDLLKYGMFHLKDINSPLLLPHRLLDELHTPLNHTPFNKYYAYGWGVLQLGSGKNTLISNGAIDGAASTLLLLPDRDIAIACLTNATVGNDFTDQFAYAIAEKLLPGYLSALGEFIQTNAAAFTEKPMAVVDSLLGKWEGDIQTDITSLSVTLTFESSGKVFLQLQNQPATVLTNVRTANGLIMAQGSGRIPFLDAGNIPQYLELVLKPDKHSISGSISAQSHNTSRPYFLLPAFLSVKRKQ